MVVRLGGTVMSRPQENVHEMSKRYFLLMTDGERLRLWVLDILKYYFLERHSSFLH